MLLKLLGEIRYSKTCVQILSFQQNLERLVEIIEYGNQNPMQFLDDFSSGKITIPEKISIETVCN